MEWPKSRIIRDGGAELRVGEGAWDKNTAFCMLLKEIAQQMF